MPIIMPLPRISRTNSVPFRRRRSPCISRSPRSGRAVDQPILVHRRERRETGCHGEIDFGEGRAMHEGPVHAIEHPIEDPAPHRHRADRHEAARERLGEQDDVRLGEPVLAGEEPASAAHAALDLVGHEERLVAPAEPRRGRQVIVRRYIDTFALHRLDDERGNFLGRERLLEGV
jgi:hypothetical protein